MELFTFALLSLAIINAIYLVIPYIVKFDGEYFVELNGKIIPIKIKKSQYVNAFSLYNGTIILTSKSLELEENEVKAIVAHELGHLKLHHHLKMLIVINLLVFILLNLVNELIGFILTAIFLILFQRFLSRRFELEADLFASQMVGKEFLKKVILTYGETKSNILSTHPSSLTRVKNI